MLRALGLLLILFAAAPALAQHMDERLKDPAQEARAVEVSRELRCLVCQNQSIEDSNAPLAADLRRIVRERIAAGDSDAGVRDYVVQRYGEWVLLAPRFNARTYLLWLGPPILLLLGALAVFFFYRRQRQALAGPAARPPALSEAEAARLAALLADKDGTP